MPKGARIAIYFSNEILEELKRFITDKYGVKRALSLVVEEAVKEYLSHHKMANRS